MSNDLYNNYVTNQLGYAHKDDFLLMEKYFKKNIGCFIPSKDAKILDVGCGMGHLLFFLKRAGFSKVTAIDLSQECIEYCLKKELIDKQNVHLLDMEKFLAERPNSFDVIVLSDVIEHLPKHTILPGLKLVKEALRPGGRVVIKVVNAANPITGNASRFIDFTHTVGFTEESLAQLLRMASFAEVQIFPNDIWVFNPLVNLLGKLAQGMLSLLFRGLNLLYGRRSTRIFTKDLIAVGYC